MGEAAVDEASPAWQLAHDTEDWAFTSGDTKQVSS